MKNPAPTSHKLIWLAVPLGVAVWHLVEALILAQASLWAHYLGEPLPLFWCLVVLLGATALWRPVPLGVVRAGVFVWCATLYGILPTQAGSMAAHPDYFLEEAIDQVSERLWRARQQGTLPKHLIDRQKMLQLDGSLHYRRAQTRTLPIEVRLSDQAKGPTTEPADRPGVIHVAFEAGRGRIWITATSIGFARFGAPQLLPDRKGNGPMVLELGAEKSLNRRTQPTRNP